MRDYIRLAGTLAIVCIVAAALLGLTNIITADKIVEQTVKANTEARRAVFMAANSFDQIEFANEAAPLVAEVYEAKQDGSLIGYVFKSATKGYAGTVEIMVGIDMNGVVQGVKVGNNNETPGLGKKAEEAVFQQQFSGKLSSAQVAVVKNGTPKENEVVAIAGATITSKAVADGVNQAMAAFKQLAGK